MSTARMSVSVRRDPDLALERSVGWLRDHRPEMSAYRTITRGQGLALAVVLAALAAGLAVNLLATVIAINLLATTLYVIAFLYKLFLAGRAVTAPQISVSVDEAMSFGPSDLPRYTVLVAAYREAEVIASTIRAVDALDYPRSRLEVLILLEEDDDATIAAALAASPPQYMRIVILPRAHPLTKPKACNYGLAQARGELVTIFDAEDRPEPFQLRRAAAAFLRLPSSVACLQARLSYHNPQQNLITRLFTAEYLTWFSMLLPALASRGGPVPLGGTSMHVRRAVLDAVGGWDPYNVTEDADLGVRLKRYGYDTAVLDSETLEEANSDFVNWVKQRSRWYKGYIQTWLVHMRDPLTLHRELGTEAFISFSLTVGATPAVALLNPVFWTLTVLWFATKSALVQPIFPPSIYYAGLLCMLFGNFLAMYLNIIAIRTAGRPELIGSVLLSPLYWGMMSIAAIKALIQLVIDPSFWEKTAHGLDRVVSEGSPAPIPVARWSPVAER